MSRKDAMKCPFCASTQIRDSWYPKTSFNNTIFNYEKCSDCALIFLSPMPSNEDLAEMYKAEYHDQFYFAEGRDQSFKLALLKSHVQGSKLVDFGCGDAAFVKQAQEVGLDCTGVEYDPILVDKLNEDLPKSTFTTTEHFFSTSKSTFDIFHLGDVYEHITDPTGFLEIVSKKLNPKGVICIDGPIEEQFSVGMLFRNFSFGLSKTLKPNRIATHLPYHTIFMTKNNQVSVLENNGYKILYTFIYDDTWPFHFKLSEVKSALSFIKYVIGKLSAITSSIIPSWGNRILVIAQKV